MITSESPATHRRSFFCGVKATFDLLTRGEHRLQLIGVGGILSGADAAKKMAAGASLVQCYTGLIYRGPALVGECVEAMRRRKEAPSRGNLPPHG